MLEYCGILQLKTKMGGYNMIEIIKPEEILAELEKNNSKDLECIYITTNAFDIYLK